MKKIFFLLLVLQSTLAFCQNDEFYLEGTLGKSKIYMRIYVFGSPDEKPNTTAVYFYQNSLKDIPLEGTRKNNDYTLEFEYRDTIYEKFSIKKLANNHFEGTWKNYKGKSYLVNLSPINFSNYKANLSYSYSDEKLNFVKSKYIEFKIQKTTTYKNKQIEWYSEKHCDVKFFRLGSSFSDKNKNAINPILKKLHIESTLDELNCTNRNNYNDGGGFSYDTSLTFLNNNLLGFKTDYEVYCGGAYPDNGTTGYLIDLNTGKNYEIDDIIAFDKSVTTEKESDFDTWVKYRQAYFAPKLFAIINSEQHFQKPKNTDDDPCDMTDLDRWWGDETWVYSEKGIEFTPSFPHVIRSCTETYFVPFEKLRKYKNPKFKYNLN